jgi:hypothetical protein
MTEIDATELASWLAEQPADILWSVDGEERLAGDLSLPCTGEDLATALRVHGGRIRVELPESEAPDAGDLTRANIEKAAEREDGARIFRLAWATSEGAGEPWLLVEDTLAKAASASASQLHPTN